MQEKQLKLFSWLDKFEIGAVTLLLSAMTVVVFLQIFFRFVIKGPLPWSEELARYLMVWAVFIGASMGAKEGAHIGVKALVSVLPLPAKRVAVVLAGLLSLAFCLLIVVLSWEVVMFQTSSGQLSPAMEIPIYWAYLAVPVGSLLMGLRFIQFTLIELRSLEVTE